MAAIRIVENHASIYIAVMLEDDSLDLTNAYSEDLHHFKITPSTSLID